MVIILIDLSSSFDQSMEEENSSTVGNLFFLSESVSHANDIVSYEKWQGDISFSYNQSQKKELMQNELRLLLIESHTNRSGFVDELFLNFNKKNSADQK